MLSSTLAGKHMKIPITLFPPFLNKRHLGKRNKPGLGVIYTIWPLFIILGSTLSEHFNHRSMKGILGAISKPRRLSRLQTRNWSRGEETVNSSGFSPPYSESWVTSGITNHWTFNWCGGLAQFMWVIVLWKITQYFLHDSSSTCYFPFLSYFWCR